MKGEEQGSFGWGLGIAVQALTQEPRDISKMPYLADSLSIPASQPPGLPGHSDLASPEGSAPHPSPQIFLCKCLWLCSQILFSYTSSLI